MKHQVDDIEADCQKLGSNMCLSGGPWLLQFLCMKRLSEGQRVTHLTVPTNHWMTFCGEATQNTGEFGFDGDTAFVDVAPAGWRVRVTVDPRLGPLAWRWTEEPWGK